MPASRRMHVLLLLLALALAGLRPGAGAALVEARRGLRAAGAPAPAPEAAAAPTDAAPAAPVTVTVTVAETVSRCRKLAPTFSPVCGSNNVTYLNSKWAGCVGVTAFTPGPCLAAENILRSTCEHLCVREAYTPVCGEDGLTYANACVALCAGIGGYSPGVCCASALRHCCSIADASLSRRVQGCQRGTPLISPRCSVKLRASELRSSPRIAYRKCLRRAIQHILPPPSPCHGVLQRRAIQPCLDTRLVGPAQSEHEPDVCLLTARRHSSGG